MEVLIPFYLKKNNLSGRKRRWETQGARAWQLCSLCLNTKLTPSLLLELALVNGVISLT